MKSFRDDLIDRMKTGWGRFVLASTPLLKVNYSKDCGGGGWWVLSCVVDHILQEFNNMFLTRFRTFKIATPPQTKTPEKTTFRD
jgi:hypothetical protein